MRIVTAGRPSYSPTVPLENRGVYLVTPRGAMQLYSWVVPPEAMPSDSPFLSVLDVHAIVAVQRAFDEPTHYRLYALASGRIIPWRRAERAPHLLRLTPAEFAAGDYMLIVPSDGMYGGETRHYFRLR
ncbi:MAG: hypothetical protein M3068_02265 [Gemmatimonadota bacterium]|nr:hypothetical protein [Gemmatimonadota bacterium]